MDSVFTSRSVAILLNAMTMIIFSSAQQIEVHSPSTRGTVEHDQYFFYQRSEYPKDCNEVKHQCSSANSSGVYIIKPDGIEPFEVFCNHDADTGGWTVIQRRENGYLNFNRSWSAYKEGFGFLSTEFWLGSDKLSHLTNQAVYELRVDIQLYNGASFHTIYKGFRVADEFGEYQLLHIGPIADNSGIFISTCPENMKYQTCTCQTTCEDPDGESDCHGNCSGVEGCICQEGYKINGSDCIHMNECGCFLREANFVIPDGGTYINENCTQKCHCNNNILSCDDVTCDANAECIMSNEERQCSCNEGYQGDGETCEALYTDCKEIYDAGVRQDGVYAILPTGWTNGSFTVYCKMDNGGGWTLFQRRTDGVTDFYRDWNEYKEGFGDLVNFSTDFWLGNEKLHFLTNQGNYKLRFDVISTSDVPFYAEYSEFQVESEDTNYRMNKLGSHSGTTGQHFYASRGKQFSARGRDNDPCGIYHCAEKHRSGWWHSVNWCSRCYDGRYCGHFHKSGNCYSLCTDDNLNGHYGGGDGENVFTYDNRNDRHYCGLRYVEMKIRPLS